MKYGHRSTNKWCISVQGAEYAGWEVKVPVSIDKCLVKQVWIPLDDRSVKDDTVRIIGDNHR